MSKGILDQGRRWVVGIVGLVAGMTAAGGCASGAGHVYGAYEPVRERAARVAAQRLAEPSAPIAGPATGQPVAAARSNAPVGGGCSSSFWNWDETVTLVDLGNGSSSAARADSSAKGAATTAPAAVQRGPLPGFWETVERDLKLFPKSLWEDTKKVYTDPVNLIVLLSAGGASLALRPEVDDDFEDDLRGKDIFKDDWNDAFGAMGNPGTHFALAGVWYLAGQQMQNIKTYEVGRTLFNALAINGVSTILLQVAAYTEVPNGERLGWPSGHTSSTVTLAAVLDEAYGPLVGVPLYALAGLVAVERMDDEEHHFSDVVFGAALGYVIGKTVAKGHRPEIFGGEIVPYADPVGGSSGLAWMKTFH